MSYAVKDDFWHLSHVIASLIASEDLVMDSEKKIVSLIMVGRNMYSSYVGLLESVSTNVLQYFLLLLRDFLLTSEKLFSLGNWNLFFVKERV